MLRIVILSIFLAQLQGLHMEPSLDENVKLDNQENEKKLQYYSRQAQMSQVLAMPEEHKEALHLHKIEKLQEHELEESTYAEEPDVEAMMTRNITWYEGCNDEEVWPGQQYHLSASMCEKTRPHRSESSNRERVLNKLRRGECIEVTVLGGSVSFGNCMIHAECMPHQWMPDKEHNVWCAQFVKWLNQRFPCGGEGHVLNNMAEPAKGSDYWSDIVSFWKNDPEHVIWKSDIVFVETGVNDVINTIEHDPGQRTGIAGQKLGHEQWKAVQRFTEITARQLTYAPNRPWTIWAELSWEAFEPGKPPPGHWDATVAHTPVLQHYDVDQVSILDAFLPINSDQRKQWLQNTFFYDHAHPTILGHQMCAQIMAYMVVEEMHFQELENTKKLWPSTLPAGLSPDTPPSPLYISEAVAQVYDTGRAQHFPLWDASTSNQYIIQQNGFEIFEDVPGKPGVIAQGVNSSLQLAMPFPTYFKRDAMLVNIGLMKSYEHMGMLEISYAVLEGTCDQASEDRVWKVVKIDPVDTEWYVPVSVRQVVPLVVAVPSLDYQCLVVNFYVPEANPPRAENKVKLLDITFI